MNTDNTPLVSKLTLLVLSLILVCLVLLVFRAYQKPRGAFPSLEMTEVESTADYVPPPPPPPAADARSDDFPSAGSGNAGRVVPSRSAQPPRSVTVAGGASARESTSGSAADPVAGGDTVPLPAVGIVDGNVGGAARGEIVGFATLTGTPKPEIPIELGAICGSLNPGKPTTRHFVVGANRGLANVFVYLRSVNGVAPNVPPAETPLLDQAGCMYEPYVMGVLAGQTFRIRNSDPTFHNVHATPKLNREFNLSQPIKDQVTEKSFSTPELFVRIKCDVHPWMFAYVSVMAHPFFAVTDSNGFFRLPAGLPAGTYAVSAAHLKAGEITQEIVVQDGEQKALTFEFSASPVAQPQGSVVRSN